MLTARNNLALAYQSAGRVGEAIAVFEDVVKRRTATLGAQHRDTLGSRSNLAASYLAMGRPADAVAPLEEILKIETAELGGDNRGTLATRNNLAVAYHRAGRTADALATWEAMLPDVTAAFGESHPNTLATLGSLCAACEAAGQWARAEPLRERLVAARRKTMPPESRALAGELAQLGLNLLKQEKWTAAEPVLVECLKIRAHVQPDDWTTFNTRSALGACLLGQKKFAEAEPLVVGGYEGMKAREGKIPPVGKPRLGEAAARLVKLYEAWGKPEKAALWRERLGLELQFPTNVFTH